MDPDVSRDDDCRTKLNAGSGERTIDFERRLQTPARCLTSHSREYEG